MGTEVISSFFTKVWIVCKRHKPLRDKHHIEKRNLSITLGQAGTLVIIYSWRIVPDLVLTNSYTNAECWKRFLNFQISARTLWTAALITQDLFDIILSLERGSSNTHQRSQVKFLVKTTRLLLDEQFHEKSTRLLVMSCGLRLNAHLHDNHFGHGTPKFWHAG